MKLTTVKPLATDTNAVKAVFELAGISINELLKSCSTKEVSAFSSLLTGTRHKGRIVGALCKLEPNLKKIEHHSTHVAQRAAAAKVFAQSLLEHDLDENYTLSNSLKFLVETILNEKTPNMTCGFTALGYVL